MNIKEFEQKYATNDRRIHLFKKLLDELQFLQDHSTSIRVIVFGSYITENEAPKDIDVLVHSILNNKGVDLKFKEFLKTFPTNNYPEIHLKGTFSISSPGKELKKADEIIFDFIAEEENKMRSITISNYLVIEL